MRHVSFLHGAVRCVWSDADCLTWCLTRFQSFCRVRLTWKKHPCSHRTLKESVSANFPKRSNCSSQLAEFGELQDFNLKSVFVPQNPICKDFFFFFKEWKRMHLFCACAGKLVSFWTRHKLTVELSVRLYVRLLVVASFPHQILSFLLKISVLMRPSSLKVSCTLILASFLLSACSC